jgi:hypothetical protein
MIAATEKHDYAPRAVEYHRAFISGARTGHSYLHPSIAVPFPSIAQRAFAPEEHDYVADAVVSHNVMLPRSRAR